MKAIISALIKAQLVFKPLTKTAKNPFFKSNYATLDDCITATRDALSANCLVITQPTVIENGILTLQTRLMHESGEEILSAYPIVPIKPDPQGYGSALTYARRYAYCSILGLVAEEDDDGNAGSKQQQPPKQLQKPIEPTEPIANGIITPAQVKRLQSLRTASGKTAEECKAILSVFGYGSSKEIKITDYDKICTEIEKKQETEPLPWEGDPLPPAPHQLGD